MDPELTRELKLREAATDERVGLFTPDKDGDTADGAGCVPVLAARRGTVCGEVGRVPRFPQLTVHTLYSLAAVLHTLCLERCPKREGLYELSRLIFLSIFMSWLLCV